MALFVAVVVGVVQLAIAPFTGVPPKDTELFEQLMFATPLAAFVVIADSGRPTSLDWSTDHCSAPLVGNTGRSFDFTHSCRRHDFAYRNLKMFDRRAPKMWWNTEWRARVDEQFRRDLRGQCVGRPLNQRITCRWWAEIFYRAVRTFAGP